jgi:ubiquinone/menaquinone biosynthesis C-methylase UbiE
MMTPPARKLVLSILALSLAAAPPRASSSFPPEKILDAIGVGQGGTVCGIGAGEGDSSIAIARILGPDGRVYASELGGSRLARLRSQAASSGLSNITVVQGDPAKTNFPDAACDGIFMRDAYHHFSDPASINRSIAAALKPGGRVVVIDFRPPSGEAPDPGGRAKGGTHGVNPETVSRELRQAGLEPLSSDSSDRRWFILVLSKSKQ